jgi:cytoplasmic iron level regulating protein YaaA (DUF328/UPF0246 family)
MLILVSPAKKLHADPAPRPLTRPRLEADTAELLGAARALDAPALAALMHISDPLARLNAARYAGWDDLPETPALTTFAGDTYVGLDAATLDEDAWRRADDRLRILSGLYGLLRPRDAIRPYRLEMGSRLATDRGRDLYAFWGTRIARTVTADAQAAGTGWVLNCASQEYVRAVDPAALRPRMVTPTFLEDRPGGPKVVGFHAKRARGALARFVLEERIEHPGDLRAFAAGGYTWRDGPAEAPVFLRAQAAAA